MLAHPPPHLRSAVPLPVKIQRLVELVPELVLEQLPAELLAAELREVAAILLVSEKL